MDEKLIWISFSLFSAQSNWNYILNKGLRRFLAMSNNDLYSFQIQLSFSGGENIRVALLAEIEKAEPLSKKANIFFKRFFLNAALPVVTSTLEHDIFMPFPRNSIQYGLFRIDASKETKKANFFYKEFSLIMIEALGEEIIDQETLITFAFYLHIALIAIVNRNTTSLIKDLLSSYDHKKNESKDDAVSIDFITATYERDKVVLSEILNDIFNSSPVNNNLSVWLVQWMKICEGELELEGKKEENYSNNYVNIYSKISHIISQYLGLNTDMKLLLQYYIVQSLSKELTLKK